MKNQIFTVWGYRPAPPKEVVNFFAENNIEIEKAFYPYAEEVRINIFNDTPGNIEFIQKQLKDLYEKAGYQNVEVQHIERGDE